MVSGYFDPIHPGHISYIQEASKLGDWLIVVVDGDPRAVKKKGKPFIPAKDRAMIVRAISGVDEVYIEDVDVKHAIMKYKPDILAKGGDRDSRENIPEWDLCEQMGIEVVTGVGADKEWSSSDYLKEWEDFRREQRINILNDN